LPSLHSFPTRRSSDLAVLRDGRAGLVHGGVGVDLEIVSRLGARAVVTLAEDAIVEDHAGTVLVALPGNDEIARCVPAHGGIALVDRKSTRLNSSHEWI